MRLSFKKVAEGARGLTAARMLPHVCLHGVHGACMLASTTAGCFGAQERARARAAAPSCPYAANMNHSVVGGRGGWGAGRQAQRRHVYAQLWSAAKPPGAGAAAQPVGARHHSPSVLPSATATIRGRRTGAWPLGQAPGPAVIAARSAASMPPPPAGRAGPTPPASTIVSIARLQACGALRMSCRATGPSQTAGRTIAADLRGCDP